MLEGRVVVEVCCETRDFFREMELCDLVTIVRASRWHHFAGGQYDLATCRKMLWDNSRSVAIDNTGDVDYSVVDNRQDTENSELSWIELYEQMRDEGIV